MIPRLYALKLRFRLREGFLKMVDDGYSTVRLPKSLLDEVDKLKGKRGFTGRSDVIKQAVREYLDECYRRGIIQ